MANSKEGDEIMKTKKAAGLTAAKYNKRHNKAYLQAESLSTLEMLIGGLLLLGNRKQKAFWPLLEATLRQYVDLRLTSQHGSDKPESTISHRPE